MHEGRWNRDGRHLPIVSTRNLGWTALTSASGRALLKLVCAMMAWRLLRMRGKPVAVSRREIIGLWRVDAYGEVALGEDPWTLRDGAVLTVDVPVLEMHINGPRLQVALADGERWRDVVSSEFRSVAPDLQERDEVAIVGSTILARQVESFGATTRPAPDTAYAALDTFYRKLILAAFHPGGARRILTENQTVVDAAISVADFCALYGKALDASPP